MDGIGPWIRKVRQEVELALSDPRPLPSAARLVADRVTLTLRLPVPEGSAGSELTIEFQVGPPGLSAAPVLVPEPAPVACPPEEIRQLVVDTAAAVFGPGGFDNSARAEVFCETVSGMPAADVMTVLELIAADPTTVPGNALQYPFTRLRQLLGFSPLGTQSAAKRLRDTLRQISSEQLVAILGEEWRFGTHWPSPPHTELSPDFR